MKNRYPMLLSGIVALTLTASAFDAADSHPDLTGTYDVSTLTPLQRPEEFGNNLELTPAQASAIVEENRLRSLAADENRGPVSKAPPTGGAAPIGADDSFRENLGAGNVGGYNNFWIDRGSDVFMVDGKFRTSIITDPENGRIPSMTPAATQRVMERRKLRRPNDGTAWWLEVAGPGPYDGPEMLGISERCILGFTGSTPTFPSLYNNFKRLVQTEDHVMILLEMVHDARIVRMNSEHLPADATMWLGDSIGWWEGDTLVVDTTNFHPLSRPGRVGSVGAHVVERFTRLDDGNLNYRFTVEDPTVWTEPWSGEYIWRVSDDRLYEYACHEGNYSLTGVLSGARYQERMEAQESTR